MAGMGPEQSWHGKRRGRPLQAPCATPLPSLASCSLAVNMALMGANAGLLTLLRQPELEHAPLLLPKGGGQL